MQMQTFTALHQVSQGLVSIKQDTQFLRQETEALRRQLLDTTEIQVPRLFIVIPDPEAKKWYRPK